MSSPTDLVDAERRLDRLQHRLEVREAPLVPELSLRLASELIPIWEASEAEHGAKVEPPFWAFAWPGGIALARYVLDHPGVVSDRHVIDCGSGCGIAGLAARRAGAAAVLCVDLDPLAAAAARANARLNRLEIATRVGDVASDDALVPCEAAATIVLAADVCYERTHSARISRWLRALAGAGAAVFLADPGRRFTPDTGLTELARYDVPTLRELEDTGSMQTRVWRLG